MKERIFPAQTLTAKATPSTLERGVKNMAEPGRGDLPPRPQAPQGGTGVAERTPRVGQVPPRLPIGGEIVAQQTAGERQRRGPVPRDQAEQIWRSYWQARGRPIDTLTFEERQTMRLGIEMGLPPLGGGAPGVPVEGGWNDALKAKMEGMNAALDVIEDEDVENQLDQLIEARKAIGELRGIPDDEKIEAFNRIGARVRELREARRNAPRRPRRDFPADRVFINEASVRVIDRGAAYASPEVQRIADEVAEALRDNRVNNTFLNQRIRLVADIVSRERTPEEAREAGRLRHYLEEIKNVLYGKTRGQYQAETGGGMYGEYKLTEDDKIRIIELAAEAAPGSSSLADLEKEFNGLFVRVDVNSDAEWRDALGPGGEIEINMFILTLQNAAESRELPSGEALTEGAKDNIRRVVRRFEMEKNLREYLHSVSYAVNSNLGIPDLARFMKGFRAGGADVAFSIKGVSTATRLYEQAMYQVMAENGGYLSYADMVNTVEGQYGKVEDLVRKQMLTYYGKNNIQDWEIGRAIALARGMGIMRGRWFEIAASGGMPKNVPLTSWWANPIIKRIAFHRQLMRFEVGKERLTMLAYPLEKRGKVWSVDEQRRLGEAGYKALFDILIKEGDKDLFLQILNPMRIGSLETQTGWRYSEDQVNLSSAVAHLLEDDLYNPLIGIGLWIEKQRGNLQHNVADDPISPEDHEKLVRRFGAEVAHFHSKGEMAEFLIVKNLRLAAKIAPLKLFNDLTSLRRDVLLRYYGPEVNTPEGVEGAILIKEGSNLRKDLSALAIVQEKLVVKRADVYKEFLEKKEQFEQRLRVGEVREEERERLVGRPPDLYQEYTDLERMIEDEFLEGGLEGGEAQKDRVLLLVRHIREEFSPAEGDGGHSRMHELVENLKEKGWKVPFIFGGTTDIPFHMFQYIKTGADSFHRRAIDWEAVDAAGSATEEYLMSISKVTKKEDLIQGLEKVYHALRGHDEGIAREHVAHLVEATALWFKKDWKARLPLGFGTIFNLVTGESSLAQVFGGREKMAWDEVELDGFLKLVHGAEIVDEHQLDELRNHVGAEGHHIAWGVGRTVVQFLIIAYILYMLKKQIEEK